MFRNSSLRKLLFGFFVVRENLASARRMSWPAGWGRETTQEKGVMVVLGQSLMWDEDEMVVPPTLKSRIETAAGEYFWRRSRVLVSGADCAGVGVTEAEVMRDLLVAAGLPSHDIELDKEARNTVENAINCLHDLDDVEVTIVTSSFHLPRSTYIFQCVARHLGKNIPIRPVAAENRLPFRSPWVLRDINDLSAPDRLRHELSLLTKGATQDDHFSHYDIPPCEVLRRDALLKIDALLLDATHLLRI